MSMRYLQVYKKKKKKTLDIYSFRSFLLINCRSRLSEIMARFVHRFYDNITRKKTYDTESMHTSPLRRCLTVFDLTILGKIDN